jgi:pilus assembly protein CpaB
LLRRTQSISTKAAIAAGPSPEATAPDAGASTSAPAGERRQGERRQGERRGMEALRAEALEAVIARVEDRNFGGLRDRVRINRNFFSPRLLLVVVAVLAGGLAALLALQQEQPAVAATQPAAPPPPPMTHVLVARQAIGPGQHLSADALAWQDWPDAAVRPEYVTQAAQPDAMSTLTASVARSAILAGEPILPEKLGKPSQGYLSALLDDGMRGVSVSVAAEAASGGFVAPDDRVDVVLTRSTPGGQTVSEMILQDVRVLAINARLGSSAGQADGDDQQAKVFSNEAIATLALNPKQAAVVINASTMGKLSLMLRPTADPAQPSGGADELAANAAIRMSSPFWTN